LLIISTICIANYNSLLYSLIVHQDQKILEWTTGCVGSHPTSKFFHISYPTVNRLIQFLLDMFSMLLGEWKFTFVATESVYWIKRSIEHLGFWVVATLTLLLIILPHHGAANAALWWGIVAIYLDPLGSRFLFIFIPQI